MTICKNCVYCERVRYDGSNRSKFREGDDYLYYCYKYRGYVIETQTCKNAESK